MARPGFRGAAALRALVVPMLLLAAAGPAVAANVLVNCNAGKTISSGLTKLSTAGPSVLNISGVCRENVTISGFHNLEVIAAPGTELWPAPSGPGTSWTGTYVMEVVGSTSVTIKGLSVHAAGVDMGIAFLGSVECLVENSSIDGPDGFAIVIKSSSVRVSDVQTQDRSGIWLSDASSAWVKGFNFDGGDKGWAGIMAGSGGVAYVQDSVFHHSGVGLHATGGVINAGPWTPNPSPSLITIENNSCGGVWVNSGGSFNISSPVSVLVSDNGSESCPGAGVGVSSGGRVELSSIEVRNEHGPGISLSGQALATLGDGIKVTANLWAGLDVIYDSIAVGPPIWNTSTTIAISGTSNGADLSCDDSSRITGMAHFTGTPVVNCPNFLP